MFYMKCELYPRVYVQIYQAVSSTYISVIV